MYITIDGTGIASTMNFNTKYDIEIPYALKWLKYVKLLYNIIKYSST